MKDKPSKPKKLSKSAILNAIKCSQIITIQWALNIRCDEMKFVQKHIEQN